MDDKIARRLKLIEDLSTKLGQKELGTGALTPAEDYAGYGMLQALQETPVSDDENHFMISGPSRFATKRRKIIMDRLTEYYGDDAKLMDILGGAKEIEGLADKSHRKKIQPSPMHIQMSNDAAPIDPNYPKKLVQPWAPHDVEVLPHHIEKFDRTAQNEELVQLRRQPAAARAFGEVGQSAGGMGAMGLGLAPLMKQQSNLNERLVKLYETMTPEELDLEPDSLERDYVLERKGEFGLQENFYNNGTPPPKKR